MCEYSRQGVPVISVNKKDEKGSHLNLCLLMRFTQAMHVFIQSTQQ